MTKIVATIGPASSAQGILEDMMRAGLNVARINFSHGDYDSNLLLLDKVRAAALAAGKSVAVMQDLQGPKIRVGVIPGEGFDLIEGHIVRLHAGVVSAEDGVIPVPYERLAHDVRRGDRLLLDDGTKELEVVEKKGPIIRARVVMGGRLLSYKGINVPTVSLSVDSMTEKDDRDLEFGVQQNVDLVALSFVRRAEDVRLLKEKISRWLPEGMEPPGVIAKIEKHEALEHFDEILKEVDGVMIARGDLGLETPASRVPLRQKELIAKCVAAAKPVIVATHMLDSMQNNSRPTRAEVSDVANAVMDHADAVMLSGETAMGRFPVKSIQVMREIATDTEEPRVAGLETYEGTTAEPVPFAVASAAVGLARQTGAVAILVTTRSGFSARAIARLRPKKPIYAATDRLRTRNRLILSWGVEPLHVDGYDQPQLMAEEALRGLIAQKKVSRGDKVVIVSGLKAHEEGKYDSAVRLVEA